MLVMRFCPFCGGPPTTLLHEERATVTCVDCGACVIAEKRPYSEIGMITVNRAVAKWNQRETSEEES